MKKTLEKFVMSQTQKLSAGEKGKIKGGEDPVINGYRFNFPPPPPPPPPPRPR